MLVRTIDELRLFFPAHAISDMDPLMGFIDNSEHDFLLEKLGQELYVKVCDYYRTMDKDEYESMIREGRIMPYAMQLVNLCQRVVIYDAFARAISVHAISVNDSGINTAVADDYQKVDMQAVAAFKTTCIKESHAAVNRLLQVLEYWSQSVKPNDDTPAEEENEEVPTYNIEAQTDGDEDITDEPTDEDEEEPVKLEIAEIITLWRKSRYYYLCAQLLIPSAVVLQNYLNIYESREKFIQMIPDLRYIQEEFIHDTLGEEFTDYLAERMAEGALNAFELRVIHRCRKAMAALLEERTEVIKFTDKRRVMARAEAMKHLTALKDYCAYNQSSVPAAILPTCPFYVNPANEQKLQEAGYKNLEKGSVIFVTDSML